MATEQSSSFLFYAHSKEGEPPEKWQRLEDHLRNVAEKMKGFASTFGMWEWGNIAGLCRDEGKHSIEF